jgi:iron(III) transport system permease protein
VIVTACWWFSAWLIILQSFVETLYKKTAFTLITIPIYSAMLASDVLVYTAAFAVATTIIAVIIGIVLAVIINRTNIPLRTIFQPGHDPILRPPLVLALWMQMYAHRICTILSTQTAIWQLYSFGGIVIVSAMYYIPYTFLYASSSLALADPQLESAARIGGASPFRTILSAPSRFCASHHLQRLLTLVSSFELLSIPWCWVISWH